MRAAVMIVGCLLSGCITWGSTTTLRPALSEPPVRPDGVFYDAAGAAQRKDLAAFRFLISPRFLHESLLPGSDRYEPASAEGFTAERARLEAELAPYEATVVQMLWAHMEALATLTRDRFVEVSEPRAEELDRNREKPNVGPNRASVTVRTWGKLQGAEARPETLEIQFIQDGQRWIIDGIEPDRLKGAFTR